MDDSSEGQRQAPDGGPGRSADAPRTPILIRHHGFHKVGQEELLQAVGGLSALERVPVDLEVDTGLFAEQVDNGYWGPSHGEVWSRALAAQGLLQRTPNPRLIYGGGMPEVPHAVAFGAYLGDQWSVEPYDYHESGQMVWPATEGTLTLGEAIGLPRETIPTAGPAVLRVEITARIQDEHVRRFVPEAEQIANIRIGPQDQAPAPGLVRSQADVREVRRAVRLAIASLVEHRPKLTVLHLFIAAPASACVITGQELRIRNNPPVQTYRYRRQQDGSGLTTEAIRLTAGGPGVADVPLTPEQQTQAATLREELWMPAIADVERYADRKQRETESGRSAGGRERWYDRLSWVNELRRVHPFPALPLVHQVVERPATVDPASFESGDFGFIRGHRVWRINDRFSVRLAERITSPEEARALVRIFLLHEYLHVVHGITKASYREVGKFANGLERADYMCDLYGILHELDRAVDEELGLTREFDAFKHRLAGLIDLVIRSFWAFEPPAPLEWMEIRRIRRYMNWYWQHVRVTMARSHQEVAAVLARQPVVEIAGLETRAEGRRYLGSLRRFDPGVGLELGIVLDSEQLLRVKTGVNTPLEELARAFRRHDHAAIQQIFRAVYDEAESTGHALPREDHLP